MLLSCSDVLSWEWVCCECLSVYLYLYLFKFLSPPPLLSFFPFLPSSPVNLSTPVSFLLLLSWIIYKKAFVYCEPLSFLYFFSTSKTARDNLFLLTFPAYGFCDAATICQPRKEVSQDPILMMPWTWTITIQNYEKISVCHLRCPVCGILLVPPPMHLNTAMQMPFWTSGFSSLFFNISLKELWAIRLP